MKKNFKKISFGLGLFTILISGLVLFNNILAEGSTEVYNPTRNYVGTKIWSDNNNSYNTRPTDLKVTLYADGEKTNYTPTWKKGRKYLDIYF